MFFAFLLILGNIIFYSVSRNGYVPIFVLWVQNINHYYTVSHIMWKHQVKS